MAESRNELNHIASALDSGATAFTICEIADGVALAAPAFDGVAAYHVLAGSMHLLLPTGEIHVVRADSVALVSARKAATISSGAPGAAPAIDGKRISARAGQWTIVDATAGEPAKLTVAAARIAGTTHASLSQATIVPLARDRVGRKLSTMLRAEVADPGTANGALATALMTACVVVALRRAIDETSAAPESASVGAGSSLIHRAVAAVRADPAKPHNVQSLATAAGMSRATFLRQFARTMRMSPMQFVQHTRLTEAAAMLRAGTLPIKTVAAHTGFASRSHFSRLFRKAFGRDPSGFREENLTWIMGERPAGPESRASEAHSRVRDAQKSGA